MGGPGGYQAEIIQTEKDNYHMMSTPMWNPRNETDEQTEQNRNRVTDSGNKLRVTRAEWAGWCWGMGRIREREQEVHDPLYERGHAWGMGHGTRDVAPTPVLMLCGDRC